LSALRPYPQWRSSPTNEQNTTGGNAIGDY
jgi:hypothetical protein